MSVSISLRSTEAPSPFVPNAHTERKIFSRTTSVAAQIKADPEIIWALLTNAQDFSRWNSTVISIDGDIALHEKIRLRSTLDPNRSFKLKIMEFSPGKTLVWGDTMGKRRFLLTRNTDETTSFSMIETIGSPLFPLFASKIPSFDKSFDQFAADLKKEAENIQRGR